MSEVLKIYPSQRSLEYVPIQHLVLALNRLTLRTLDDVLDCSPTHVRNGVVGAICSANAGAAQKSIFVGGRTQKSTASSTDCHLIEAKS